MKMPDFRCAAYYTVGLLSIVSVAVESKCATEGEVRLTGEDINEGRVEVCLNGEWGYVCGYRWGVLDAMVLCRELHLSTINPDALFYYGGRPPARPIHYAGFQCSGSETHLINCSVDQQVTYCQQYAGVRCLNESCIENDTRLNGGVVQVCHEGQWGLVCDHDRSWSSNDARVVCRQEGFSSKFSQALFHNATFYDVPVFLSDVACNGSEESLSQCTRNGYGMFTNCSAIAVARCEDELPCSRAGEIRLTQFPNNTMGRLEVCSGVTWGSVCGNGASDSIATVACRQLNHTASGIVLVENDYDGSLSSFVPITLTQMVCNGNELTISECQSQGVDGESDCTHEDDLIISCISPECDEKAVRLVNGQTTDDGRVEVCLNGVWGSVCDDRWDYLDATVVCHQLQYNGTSYPLFGHINTDPSPLKFHLDNVQCYGNETKLSECQHLGVGEHNCVVEREEAGVVCTNQTCNDGTIHLVGSKALSRGRVIYCYEGDWYSVCATDWGREEARVICKTLGYDTTSSVSVISDFGWGADPPLLPMGIRCNGDDDLLSSCSIVDIDARDCPKVAGVICEAPCLSKGLTDCNDCDSPSTCRPSLDCSCHPDCYERGSCCPDISHVENCVVQECETGKIRLVGGATNSSGILEVCVDGIWGKVCNYFGYWGPNNARVVCRQLGFSENNAVFVDDAIIFGEATGIALIAAVHCVGTESELFECSHGPLGVHLCYGRLEHVAVICYDDNTSCTDGDVRLKDGTDPTNGIVEYCLYRTWGSVCNDKWDDRDAKVVCRQLEYDPEDARIMEEFGTTKNRPVFLNKVECNGTEKHLKDCMKKNVTGNCNSAGVSCRKKTNVILAASQHTTIGAVVVAVIILVAVTTIAVVILIIKYRRVKKKKLLEKVQQDIFAIPGPIRTEDSSAEGNNEKGVNLGKICGTTITPPNRYATTSQSSLNVPSCEKRTRVFSHHLREFTLGKFVIKCENITLLNDIGEGEFGIVYKARLGPLGRCCQEVAIKTLKGDFDQLDVDRFVEESLKMSHFKHSHVMGLIGVCLDAGSAPYIIMPYMGNGSLLKYLKRERKNIVLTEHSDEDEIQEVQKRLLVMCSQIASGMEYLAAEKYIHRDLAARNCMIDTNFLIKITDFGLSEDVFVRNYFRQDSDGEAVKLPVKWMALESLTDGHFSEKSDVWSYGVTMWEIFSGGKTPFPGTDPATLIQMLEKGERMPLPYNAACTEEIYAMMKECWETIPDTRPSFKQLYSNISKYIERIAGYLEIGFNPFAEDEGTNESAMDVKNVGEIEADEVTPGDSSTMTAYTHID